MRAVIFVLAIAVGFPIAARAEDAVLVKLRDRETARPAPAKPAAKPAAKKPVAKKAVAKKAVAKKRTPARKPAAKKKPKKKSVEVRDEIRPMP